MANSSLEHRDLDSIPLIPLHSNVSKAEEDAKDIVTTRSMALESINLAEGSANHAGSRLARNSTVSERNESASIKKSGRPNDRMTQVIQTFKSLDAQLDRRLRQSRFHGWRMGVLSGCCLSAFVLCCNIAIIVIGAVSKEGYDNEGIANLIYGDDRTVTRWNTALHVIINALSTILLSGSNYTMQVLSSPTRDDLDAAHSTGQWLDIGILSPRNLQAIPRKRALLWFTLGFSSIPLHLFYNAAIFKVVTSNEYNVQFIDVTSLAYRQMANKTDFFDGDKLISRDYWNLTNSAWNDIYNRRYMSMNGDIYLAIDRVAFDTRDALSGSASDFVSLNATSTAKLLKDLTAESSVWLRHEYRLPGSTKTIPISVHVAHAFSEKKKGPPSRVQISLYFMLVVVTCNVLKLLVMAYILFVNRASHEGPSYIVTLGDAAASFLKYPDSNTQGKSTFGKEEMLISMGYEPVRKRVQNRDDLNRWTVLRGTWLPRPITFATGITRWHKITHTELIVFSILMLALSPLYSKDNSATWSWGSESDDSLALSLGDLTSTATLVNAGLANLPQLLLSFAYLTINTMCTSMASTIEWNNMATSRKGLRVTQPHGAQRSTYFLQLPYKWSIPLLISSGTLHWLLSQSFFLVRVDFYSRDGKMLYEKSKSACGFSTLSFYVLLAAAIFLLVVIWVLGMRKMVMHAPVVASCSLAISAACHPPPEEKDVHLTKLQWGEVEEISEDGVARCALSSREVKPPTKGKIYH